MKIRSIQSKLFLTYSTLILSIAIILGAVFYMFNSAYIHNNVLTTYKQLVSSASSQLDTLVEETDDLAIDIIVSRVPYSKETWDTFQLSKEVYLNDFFFKPVPSNTNSTQNFIEQPGASGKSDIVSSIINSVNGLKYRGTEILLYDTGFEVYSAPYNIAEDTVRYHRDQYMKKEWFDALIRNFGSIHVTEPYISRWFSSKPRYVFSLLRSFQCSTDKQKKAIIEIQQDYKKLETIIQRSFGAHASRVIIYSPDGNLVYPAGEISQDAFSPEKLAEYTPVKDQAYIHELGVSKSTGRQGMIALRSTMTGWIMIYSIDYILLYKEVYKFQNNFITIIAAMLICGFILAYLVARTITKPLKLVYSTVRNRYAGFGINKLPPEKEKLILSSTEEVSQVFTAIKETYEKLEESMHNTIEARSREAEAHWLALQSQINPHFMRNTFSIIASVSEEGDIEKTSMMCRRLSDMLDYVTMTGSSKVTLQDELEYTMSYLFLMKMRCEDHLEYSVDIPDVLLATSLPKLIIQPLVENCMNHGFKKVKPPWKIQMIGKIGPDCWELIIADNGSGISQDKLDFIHEQINQSGIQTEPDIKNPNKGGIGLIGSIIRLNLFLGNKFSYTLANEVSGGFRITLRFIQ